MGKTHIEWCYTPLPDGTLAQGFSGNPWLGCDKVSPGCKHCYAEVDTPARVRRAAGLEIWGPKAPRPEVKSFWQDVPAWDRQAERLGVSLKHFCGSNCDIFEGRADLDERRARLWPLLEQTPHLTHILLTKRPENIRRMVPPSWLGRDYSSADGPPVETLWPAHVWILASVEDEQRARERIQHVIRLPAPVRGVSYEPALQGVNLSSWLRMPDSRFQCSGCGTFTALNPGCKGYHQPGADCQGLPCPTCQRKHYWCGSMGRGLDWIIVGGESGTGARRFDLHWARTTIQHCDVARVPVFMKQLGAMPDQCAADAEKHGSLAELTNWKGGDMAEWPADLRRREYPTPARSLSRA